MRSLGMFLFIFSYIYADEHKEIFVIKSGWHSGIVMKIKDINSSILDVCQDFRELDCIEIGWGDEEYYRSLEHPFWMTLKAALLPTPSVLHVRALSSNDIEHYAQEDIVQLSITNEAYTSLSKYIADSFAKKDGQLVVVSEGHYPDSRFYLSNETYHIFNTCNVWTAKALQCADLDVTPFFAIRVESLFSQLRELKQ